jgi:Ca-activated chloride channel family protein
MSFAWPLGLLGLLVIPLGVAAYWLVQRRRAKYAVRFTNLDLLANVVEQEPQWRRHLPAALYLVALAALAIALARPETTLSVPKEQATVVLVMDVSGSMNATDVEPTRLLAAEASAQSLVDNLPEEFQVALISFSNGVQTLVPPTKDREAVKQALELLRATGGTAMGDAILQAVDLVKPAQGTDLPGTPAVPRNTSPTPRAAPPQQSASDGHPAVIVLLSDGANSAGRTDPLDAANEALARGVPVFTVALGTQAGVVDVTDQLGRRRRIAVPPDEETLQQVAEITEGRFFAAPSAEDLQAVYDDLGSKIGYEDKEREITVAFAAAAAVLVLAAGGFSLLWFNRFP